MQKKESMDLKRNTVRKTSSIPKWYAKEKPKYIKIFRGYTGECFSRTLTDITEWEDFIIFSW